MKSHKSESGFRKGFISSLDKSLPMHHRCARTLKIEMEYLGVLALFSSAFELSDFAKVLGVYSIFLCGCKNSPPCNRRMTEL